MAAPPPLPGENDSPLPPPDGKQKDPPRGRKFPCRQCGAKLDFDPEARGLKCPYCGYTRSEEHTSELQSLRHLVCRLLLEKKKKDRTVQPSLKAISTARSSSSSLCVIICRQGWTMRRTAEIGRRCPHLHLPSQWPCIEKTA